MQPDLNEIINANAKKQTFDMENGVQKPDDAYNVVEDEFHTTNTQDLINEIGTEEFISKNIRVRPVSGMTVMEKDEKSEAIGRTGGSNILDMGHSIMDEEEKFMQHAQMELDEQREKIKLEKKQLDIEKAKAEEKLQKKNKRN